MKKIMSLALAATMAVAGLGLTTGASEARHRDRDRGDDFHFSLQFGNPYPYYAPRRYYRPYAPQAYYYALPPRRVYRSGANSHVAWCYDRYRSYRAYDNTYQPFNGPRRECISPYYG